MNKNIDQTIMQHLQEQQHVSMPFFKNGRTLQDILQCEIASALVQGNIRTDYLSTCYEIAGLRRPPNYLLLVQEDNCYKHYYSLPTSCNFEQQNAIIQALNASLTRQNVEGFAASISASTNIVVFLHLPAHSTSAPEQPRQIAETFQRDIYAELQTMLIIGISTYCDDAASFPYAYRQSLEELYHNLILERENIVFLKDMSDETVQPLHNCVVPLVQSLHSANKDQFQAGLADMIKRYLALGQNAQQVRENINLLIKELEAYLENLGVERNLLSDTVEDVSRRIFESQTITDIYRVMDDYFCLLAATIQNLNSGLDIRFRQVVDEYLAEHYGEAIDLSVMSQLCNYSAIHFGRLFKKNYGQNFSQYLTRYRLDKSIRFLCDSQLPIKTIALKTGFNSVSYFCTTFKNHTGLTPQKYREQHQHNRRKADSPTA